MPIEVGYRPEMPVKVTYRWETDVLKSYDGTESRHSMFEHPRQLLEYNYLVDDSIARRFRTWFFNDQDQIWRVPLHPGRGEVTDAVTAGNSNITGTFTNTEITGNTRIMIMSPDGLTWEYQTASTVGASLVTIASVTDNAYPAGSTLHVVVDAALVGHSFQRLTTALTRVSLKLHVTDDRFVGTGGTTSYQSKYVLDWRHLQSSTGESFDAKFQLMDNGANVHRTTDYEWADIIQPREYLIGTPSELRDWEITLGFIRGGWKSVWVSTWRPDLLLNAQPSPSATAIVVEEESLAPNFATEWNDHPEYQDIQIETNNSGVIRRRITSIVDNGTNLTLNLDSALPSTAGLNLDVVSFLELCTVSDHVVFDHYGTHSTLKLTLKAVQQ